MATNALPSSPADGASGRCRRWPTRARSTPTTPVPCRIAPNGQGGELSLAENVVRVAMHPADQVVAFSALADDGVSVAAIAARFGISERIVEQRLRLGNAAPELLEAYRADAIGLETLKAFAVTADHERQLAVWAQVSAQDYGPSAWQVKRLLTEERVPASAALARFVGVDAYEAAGGAVMRDLFADEHERTASGWRTRRCSTIWP